MMGQRTMRRKFDFVRYAAKLPALARCRQRSTRLRSSVDMRSGSCNGTKCVAGSSTYRLRGVCALAARIRSADVIESHVPAI